MMTELSLNILDVAENSTRAGAGLVRITVDADFSSDRLTISICDDGCGMTKEQVEQSNAERKHDENQEHNNRLPVRWLALYGPANSIRGVSCERECGGKRRQNSFHDA